MIYSIIYIFYFLFAVFFDFCYHEDTVKKKLLFFVFLCFALLVGFRVPSMWADTFVYTYSFEEIPMLGKFSFNEPPIGYSEKGFYLLSFLIKSIYANSTFYLLVISLISFGFLYKFERKYCALPFIAFAIYMARFAAGRNMMQIRAGMAIPLVLLATQMVKDRKLLFFLLITFVGYELHHSLLMVLPLYFINMLSIKKIHIVIGILVSFLLASLFGDVIRTFISQSALANELARTYIQDEGDKSYSQTLLNPVIYYQSAILFAFTFLETPIRKMTPYYDVFRNGYFYSTVLLIVLYKFAIVSGRTSTILATYEIVMVPMCLLALKKHFRYFMLFILLVLYTILFNEYWQPVYMDTNLMERVIQDENYGI